MGECRGEGRGGVGGEVGVGEGGTMTGLLL